MYVLKAFFQEQQHLKHLKKLLFLIQFHVCYQQANIEQRFN